MTEKEVKNNADIINEFEEYASILFESITKDKDYSDKLQVPIGWFCEKYADCGCENVVMFLFDWRNKELLRIACPIQYCLESKFKSFMKKHKDCKITDWVLMKDAYHVFVESVGMANDGDNTYIVMMVDKEYSEENKDAAELFFCEYWYSVTDKLLDMDGYLSNMINEHADELKTHNALTFY